MDWKEFFIEKIEVLQEAITFVLDGLYLAAWVWVQFKVDERFTVPLHLKGVEEWTQDIFRGIFAISSLVPPCLRLYKDVRIAYYRSQRSIEEAKTKKYLP